MQVVVAANERDVQASVSVAPSAHFLKGLCGSGAAGMEHVAQDDDMPGLVRLDQSRESGKVSVCTPLGNGHSARAKTRGLAQVQIGNDDRACTRPDDRSLVQKEKVFVGELNGDHGDVPGVMV